MGVAALIAAAILAAVLYPIFALPSRSGLNAILLTAPPHVLPNRKITIRNGSAFRQVTTDADGRFKLSDSEIGAATVDGFKLTRIMGRSGRSRPNRLYVYGPAGEVTVKAVDESGRPLQNVTLEVSIPEYSLKREMISMPQGTVVLHNFPLCIGSSALFASSSDPSLDLLGLHKKLTGNKLLYEFVFAPRQKVYKTEEHRKLG